MHVLPQCTSYWSGRFRREMFLHPATGGLKMRCKYVDKFKYALYIVVQKYINKIQDEFATDILCFLGWT